MAGSARSVPSRSPEAQADCCPLYHEAIELVGKRWTGAIIHVLFAGPRRFCEIGQAVPELSDRLLWERIKELEARGVVERHVVAEPQGHSVYALTEMGRDLEPALGELQSWAHRWMGRTGVEPGPAGRPPVEPDPTAWPERGRRAMR